MTRSKSAKRTIRDLSRVWPTFEESRAVSDALLANIQNPIVVAVLGQAVVEHELDVLLRRRFKPCDDGTWARLTGDMGPFSTFAAKITAGLAFRFYDDAFRSALVSIKDIRNAFAHAHKLITFSDPTISLVFQKLSLPPKKTRYYSGIQKVKRLAQSKDVGDDGNLYAYVSLCYLVSTHLLRRQMKQSSAAVKSRYRRLGSSGYSNYLGALTQYLVGDNRPALQKSHQGLINRPSLGDPKGPTPFLTLADIGRKLGSSDDNAGK